MPEQYIGTVTHYYDKPHVGVVRLGAEVDVAVHDGDRLHFCGRTTDFEQKIRSMEMDHHAIHEASPGSEVAIAVGHRVRPHDEVYLVTPELSLG